MVMLLVIFVVVSNHGASIAAIGVMFIFITSSMTMTIITIMIAVLTIVLAMVILSIMAGEQFAHDRLHPLR